jgi:hypothetical protein
MIPLAATGKDQHAVSIDRIAAIKTKEARKTLFLSLMYFCTRGTKSIYFP